MQYKIFKTLDLEGRRFFRSTEADLDLPDSLAKRLVEQGVIQPIDDEADQAAEKPAKAAKAE